jgi:hypothetical protein
LHDLSSISVDKTLDKLGKTPHYPDFKGLSLRTDKI